MTSECRDLKLLRYKGCMLGAILGDALAMPCEMMSSRSPEPLRFRKPYRGHPNDKLLPGQYTDDGQIILMSARILAERQHGFGCSDYAKELLRTHTLHKFRYADGAVIAACKKMEASGNLLNSGINSETAGCIALAIPFALAYTDRKTMAQDLAEACAVTHTSDAAAAGTIGLALMLHTLIDTGNLTAALASLDTAAEHLYPELAVRLSYAHRAADEQIPVSTVAVTIGTSSQVTQILPLAVYLCRRISDPAELLATAISCGGNCGTVAMICGAIAGSRFGIDALPESLIKEVERAGIFEELAVSLCNRAYPPEEKPTEEKTETELEEGTADTANANIEAEVTEKETEEQPNSENSQKSTDDANAS